MGRDFLRALLYLYPPDTLDLSLTDFFRATGLLWTVPRVLGSAAGCEELAWVGFLEAAGGDLVGGLVVAVY